MPWVMRVLLAIFMPPLAVVDRGCGPVLIVTLGTLLGWIPGIVLALIISAGYHPQPRTVTIPSANREFYAEQEALFNQREYIHLADGALAEIIDDDFDLPDDLEAFGKLKRS